MITKATLLKLIRKHCLNCVSGSYSEIENCTSEEVCELYPFRFGTDPNPSQTRIEAGRIRAEINFKGMQAGEEVD